jgi:mannonate dehydratase
VRVGDITQLRKIAALAELYQVRTGSHGATDLSPVCMGSALHFDLWVPNFDIQEYMQHTPETDEVFPHAYSFSDGYLYPGDVPGHGVDIDEKLAAKYPYERAYLPSPGSRTARCGTGSTQWALKHNSPGSRTL